ncbi:MAG: response regulator [Lachnospiraceae bacterium]|nr:response regulator [Lachnospiraceae bacterium]
MKSLITDDEYATRNSIKHLIDRKRTGIDFICEAENFEEAITQIIPHSPEIIITDIVMPLHDGIDLMDWILQHSSHSKIIADSGDGSFASRSKRNRPHHPPKRTVPITRSALS